MKVVTAARIRFRNIPEIDKKVTSTIPVFTSIAASTTAAPLIYNGLRD
jgi:hypothetical protein